MKFTGKLNHKMSITCRSCRSCQQISPIFPSSTQRISPKLYMWQHKNLFSSLIISVLILTNLVLYKMYSNNYIMASFCWIMTCHDNVHLKKYLRMCFSAIHTIFKMIANDFKAICKYSVAISIISFLSKTNNFRLNCCQSHREQATLNL